LRGRDEEEVKQRIETLQLALRRTVGVLLAVAVAFVILAEVGVNIAPFLAGFGIAGVAVAFAAQHLVRDVLNGLIMLAEDWYSKGDVVRVAGVSGVVEDITLRRTVLRDLDGIVHSVPNGEITVASNFTKEWSRVNLNVGVGYGEDLDRVIAVINQVGRELADDPYWGTLVLEPPSVLRVDNLGDSGVEIKVLGNTRPIKQWDVMGELRLRLKRRFDQEGIEIPWPHTKVYFGNPLEQRATQGRGETSSREAAVATFTMEAPHALAERERLLPVIHRNPFGLITDLDGTISPISATPEEALVPDGIKALLQTLSQTAALVAVVSGRTASQTKQMVGVPGLTYIGNHGLETMEKEEVRLAPGAEQFLSEISRALDETEGVTRLPGVRIERKGITASIHYRQADDPDVARSAILAAIARSPTAARLKVTEGRRVVELRPPLAINKGTTVHSLAAQHSLQGLLYLGDDSTDLDAFYALPSLRQAGMNALGIGLVSPENRPEFRVAIDLLLTSVEEVGQLIHWINEQLKEGDHHGRS
jgi:small conductance mechanosensitive channel